MQRHLGTGKCLSVFGGDIKCSCQEHWTGRDSALRGWADGGQGRWVKATGGADSLLPASLRYFLSTKVMFSDLQL